MAAKKALIIGITGQDGAYLAKYLLDKGYEVTGSSRDVMASSFANLQTLGIRDKVKLVSVSINDFRSVFNAIQSFNPDEIYNLASQSDVAISFKCPDETFDTNYWGVGRLVEEAIKINPKIKIGRSGEGLETFTPSISLAIGAKNNMQNT